MHVWRARSWEARAALEEMLPYLMCKKEEAKVAIMFHKMAQKTWRMLHQDKTKHEAAYKKLQQMKKG